MTKNQILSAIRKCARQLKRVPNRDELAKFGLPYKTVRIHFQSSEDAYREAGLKLTGRGRSADAQVLLLDWARVARKLGYLPSSIDYRHYGRFDYMTLSLRWHRWRDVPRVFRHKARHDPALAEFKYVLAMVDAQINKANIAKSDKPGYLLDGRAVYGPVLALPGLAHEPMDESGVIFVFGIVAHRLGFTVLRTQTAFPDCEALREYRPGCWQRVAIEFEFESRNFLKHGHKAADCDIIVCWRHNWDDIPKGLEVIELSKVVRTL